VPRRGLRPRFAPAWNGRAAYSGRGHYNSRLPSREVRKLCMLDEAGVRIPEDGDQRSELMSITIPK
jgi:hypothetical protein